MVQVENLKRHVASCGFTPVPCSNDECNVIVNVRDKLHHETEVCDFRKLKCHDCGRLKNEVKEMKDEMLARQDQIKNEMRSMKEEVKSEVKGEVNKMKKEMKNEIKRMKVEMMNEMKGMLENIMKGMKREMKDEMKQVVVNAMAGMKELQVEINGTCSSDARENIFVTGGCHVEGRREVRNKSTEFFNWADQTWTLLDSAVFEGRSHTCSFLYQGQMVVAGGSDGKRTNTLKCLNVADPAATWKDFAVDLPVKCGAHKVLIHHDRLFMSGGWVEPSGGVPVSQRSDAVYEVQLVPPYSSKILTRFPQARSHHGMEMFDQKLFILGGYDGNVMANVVQYDLITNECKEMSPLPYAIDEMATVLWRINVLVIGGEDEDDNALSKVVMYNVITGRSQMLPCMKHKRRGCTAVLTGNVVVVMGGKNEKAEDLKSVECFDLERQVWQDLPNMCKARAFATAVVKPNH
jgi:hypothetical protein